MAATTFNQLHTGLVSVLQSSGLALGRIHDHEVWSTTWEGYVDAFTTEVDGQPQVRSWEVLRRSTDTEWFSFMKTVKRVYRFTLLGHQGLQEGQNSEIEFQDLCDRLMDYLDGQPDIPGVSEFVIQPTQLRDFATAPFGSVLCHHAEIEVNIEVIKSV